MQAEVRVLNCDGMSVFLNSLLATLNAREALRNTSSGGMVSIPLTDTSNSTRMSFADRSGYSHDQGKLGGGVSLFCSLTPSATLDVNVANPGDVSLDPYQDHYGYCHRSARWRS